MSIAIHDESVLRQEVKIEWILETLAWFGLATSDYGEFEGSCVLCQSVGDPDEEIPFPFRVNVVINTFSCTVCEQKGGVIELMTLCCDGNLHEACRQLSEILKLRRQEGVPIALQEGRRAKKILAFLGIGFIAFFAWAIWLLQRINQ